MHPVKPSLLVVTSILATSTALTLDKTQDIKITDCLKRLEIVIEKDRVNFNMLKKLLECIQENTHQNTNQIATSKTQLPPSGPSNRVIKKFWLNTVLLSIALHLMATFIE